MAAAEKMDGFAEQLMLLLDAVAAEVQARSETADGAVTVEHLLAEEGDVRQRFVELANQVRDVTGVDLALIEWKPMESDDPVFMINDGDQATSEWPLWRRVV